MRRSRQIHSDDRPRAAGIDQEQQPAVEQDPRQLRTDQLGALGEVFDRPAALGILAHAGWSLNHAPDTPVRR